MMLISDPQQLLGIVDSDFAQNVLSMYANGLLGDIQCLGNLAIAQALFYLCKHLNLPAGQLIPELEIILEPYSITV